MNDFRICRCFGRPLPAEYGGPSNSLFPRLLIGLGVRQPRTPRSLGRLM